MKYRRISGLRQENFLLRTNLLEKDNLVSEGGFDDTLRRRVEQLNILSGCVIEARRPVKFLDRA